MKEKIQVITHAEAITQFYGGVNELARSSLPFFCRCGSSNYLQTTKDELGIKQRITIPVMHLEDCFKHIKTIHKIRLSS